MKQSQGWAGRIKDKQSTSRQGKDKYNDEHWMAAALSLADEAEANNEVPIGALVVKDDEIIGCGYNCSIAACDPTAHAEIIAIRSAAKAINNYRLNDSKLYVTVEPCAMCVAAIVNARIEQVVYGCHEPKSGCLVSHPMLLGGQGSQSQGVAGLNWNFTHKGGVLEKECRELIQSFFKSKRSPKKIANR